MRSIAILMLGLLFPVVTVAAERPNIVLIFVDDMGYGDLGCFQTLGCQTSSDADITKGRLRGPSLTPQIDRLAEQGARFTQFYVASPICSPSRVGITTGQFPARHLIHSYLNNRDRNRERGMVDWLSPDVPCIARFFQQAGYATAHFGKWHMGGGRDVGDAPVPAAYGFDESLVSFEGLGDRILPPGRLSRQSAQLGRGKIVHVPKHEQTGIYVDRSLDFIQRHRDRSFYLHLWLNDVHDAHVPAPGEAEKYAHLTDNPNEQKFFAVLADMDRQIGRLLSGLDQHGLSEKTLVCLTSDNGPTAWPRYYESGHDPAGSTGGFRGRKWSLYEGGIRMPFIARWPGHIVPGQIDQSTVWGAVDLLPTLTTIAGIDHRVDGVTYDGIDVSPALLARPDQRESLSLLRPPLIFEYGRDETYLRPGKAEDRSPNLAIRDGQWKLLVNADGSQRELYAVGPRGEIDEFQNVAGKHPEVAHRLSEQVVHWRKALPQLGSSTERP